ncbi:MAG: DUF4388 domain-containing protein [Acidobacteria bacterium]|nr:DUF4388 domain-containing protein [Acidobacteriota bacterium]
MQDFPSQGSIDGVFLPRLIAALHLDEFEGALRLTLPEATRVLYFKRGEIASAASNAEPDRLANILIGEGRLDSEQLDLARKKLQPGESLGKTLIDMGFLTPSELLQGARHQVRLIVVSSFRATSGTYELVPGPLPPEVTSLGINTRRLIFDCLQETGDRAAVIREIGSMESVYRPTDRLALSLSALKLDFETDRIARLLDGSATLRDISSRTSLDDFTVGKVILALDLLRAAEKLPPPAGVVPPPAVVEPSPAAGLPPAAEMAAISAGRGRRIPIVTEAAEEPPEIHARGPLPQPIDRTPMGRVALIGELPGTDEAAPAEPPPVPADELPAFARPPSGEAENPEPQWQVNPETGERVHVGPIEMTFDGRVGGRPGEARGLARLLLAAGAVAIVAAAAFTFALLRRGAPAPQTSGAIVEAPGAVDQPPTVTGPPGEAMAGTGPATTTPPGREPAAPRPVPEPATAGHAPEPAADRPAPSEAVAAAPPPARPAPQAPPGPARQELQAPDFSGDPAYTAALERLDGDDAAGAAALFRDLLSARPASAVTLQLMIACREDTVKGARRRAGAQGALFVIPYSLKGRPCYRVLWGLYENADAARAATPFLPAGLIEETDPIPVSLARLLPPG